MLFSSLVMAAGVTAVSAVSLGDNVPTRSTTPPSNGDAGTKRVTILDLVIIILFALAGSFAFNVLANA